MDRELRRNISGGYANLLVTWAVQALLVPLLLTHLGRDAFGLYATLTSLAGYFTLLTFGSALTVPRYIADHAARGDSEGLSRFASTYAVLHAGVAALGLALALGAAPLLRGNLDAPPALAADIVRAWSLVAATWALGLFGGLAQSFLTGIGDVLLANVVNSARSLLTLAGAWIAVSNGSDLAGTLVALLVASLLGSVLAFVFVRRRLPAVRITPALAGRDVLKATLRPASLYFLMQVAALVVTGTDNVIIGSVLGVDHVAAYAIAFQLWSLVLAVLWSGMDALLPYFTRWDARQEHAASTEAYLTATRWTFLGGAIAAVVLAGWGGDIVQLWVGDRVRVEPGVLMVFAGMLLTATPIHTAALLLAALGRHKPAAIGGAIEAGLNLAISLALVRPLGVLGVALGTLVSGALTNAWIAPRAANRALGIPVARYARVALVPGLVALAAGALLLAAAGKL